MPAAFFSSSPNLHLCFPFAGALLLSYNFSITSQPRPGPSWYKIQGQVNGNAFFSYASGRKEVKPVGPLGSKLKDTVFGGTEREPLEDLGEELTKKLLDIKAKIFTKSDSLTIQGRLMCDRGADGHTRGSWWFAFSEKSTHLFDRVGTTHRDCKSWLQQVWEHRNEMQTTTGNSKTG
ncbi:unnamed protein product [Gulo gulo]|uniref:Uncharacterized protein n=1 Tax=Gulo gulo TaxID=48420 RepID=A0A9X9Q029_GULGU|nr:unnamed protein product [Gulo gulo]